MKYLFFKNMDMIYCKDIAFIIFYTARYEIGCSKIMRYNTSVIAR